MFQKRIRQGIERIAVVLDAGLRGRIHLVDDAADFLLDLTREALARARHANHADGRAHAPFGDHLGHDVGGVSDIARGPRRDLLGTEHDLLGRAPAHSDDQVRLELLRGDAESVVIGKPHHEAERLAVRDDGGAVHLVGGRQQAGAECMASFVDGHEPALLVRDDEGTPLEPHDDLVAGCFQMVARDLFEALAGREDRSLVQEVAEIGSRKAGCALGNGGEAHPGGKLHVAGVNIEDRLAAGNIGQADMDLAVEAAGAQERRIENVDAVRRPDDDHTGGGVEAVHLDEELVQRRLEFAIRRRSAAAAFAPDGVDLVDEDQAGSLLPRLLEQLGHAALGDADQGRREVAARHGHEGDPGLAGQCLGDQGLARPGRSDHQEAAGNPGAHLREGFGIPQEGDHLLQLGLGLFLAGDVIETVGYAPHDLRPARGRLEVGLDRQHDEHGRHQDERHQDTGQMGCIEAGLLEIDLGTGSRDPLDVIGAHEAIGHPHENVPVRH